jgi:hypothetical protein
MSERRARDDQVRRSVRNTDDHRVHGDSEMGDGIGKSPPWRSRQAIDRPLVVGEREPLAAAQCVERQDRSAMVEDASGTRLRIPGSQEPAPRRARQQAASPGCGKSGPWAYGAGFRKAAAQGAPRRATTRSVRCP